MPWDPPVTDFQASGVAILASNLNKMGNSLLFLERVAHVEFTSTVSVTGTGDVDVVSCGAITLEAVPHLVDFFAVRATAGGAGEFRLAFFDSTTELGRFFVLNTSGVANPVVGRHVFTPTAASHTIKVVGYNASSQTSSVAAGAGGTDTNMPGFISLYRLPT